MVRCSQNQRKEKRNPIKKPYGKDLVTILVKFRRKQTLYKIVHVVLSKYTNN